jgi:4-amino-4-deoxy-L-arabinose transferase-like glycosyltransferase
VSPGYLPQAPAYLAYTGGAIVRAVPLLALYALAGLAWAVWSAFRTRRPGFALAFAFVSAAAVCPGFWFRPHYFLLVLPAAAVLVGLAAAALERSLEEVLSPAGRAVAVVALAALAGAQALYAHRAILFESSPRESSRLTYPQQPFVESVDVASYIRSRTEPSDRIAVLGSEPQIYFYARRRGGTGYLYTYPMMEPQPFARRMQDEMIAEVEAAQPLFVVFVTATGSWMARQESDLAIVDWANRFVKEKYRLVGIAEVPEDDGPSALFWDDALRTYRQRSRNRMLVYRRKS